MNKKIGFLVFSVAFTLLCQAQNAVQWRYDRTGVYKETGLLKSWDEAGPQLLWHYDGLGEGHSSVAVSNSGKLYITGMTDEKGFVYAFDTNGKLLNKQEYGPEWNTNYNGTRGTVTPDNGKLYLISGLGEVFCLNESDLKILWKKGMFTDFDGANITWGICESPLIVGDKLIVSIGGKKNNVVALNKNTGALIWNCEGEGDLSAYGSPIYLSDQKIPQIVVMMKNHILGIDIATGKKLWSFEHINQHGVHPNVPVYAGNMLLFTSGYGKGSVMLRLTNGGNSVEKVWESPDLDSRIGAVVKIGDYIYGSGDKNRFWFCLDWKTGAVKYKDNSLGTGNVIACDGMLYCYSERGELALVKINPEKFEIASKYKITLGTNQHWAHPVIYKGVLYVHHGDVLMAYKIK
ncbi:MAG: PQQ-binding-like beta-propeller repeat protein [Dysgonamonadaceae bacterium]|jgi:outer membrane protein assembly factor BamB|nr:PQQ-binding-like beta-propeller repeat protein [Dysgonamonadaceae bacterium]